MTSPLRKKHRTTLPNTSRQTPRNARCVAALAALCAVTLAATGTPLSAAAPEDAQAKYSTSSEWSAASYKKIDNAGGAHKAARLNWRSTRPDGSVSSASASEVADEPHAVRQAAALGDNDKAVRQVAEFADDDPLANPFNDRALSSPAPSAQTAQVPRSVTTPPSSVLPPPSTLPAPSTLPPPSTLPAPIATPPATLPGERRTPSTPYERMELKIPAPGMTPAEAERLEQQEKRDGTWPSGRKGAKPCEDAMKECAEGLREMKAKTLRDISLDLRVAGKQGEDYPCDCPAPTDVFKPRAWEPTTYTWTASALCHKPLYFEQVGLERYGHSFGWGFDAVISGAHFFATIPVLPYKIGVDLPCDCVYSLGYYRPGSCAPYTIDAVPISTRGALFEAAAVTGLVFLLP